MNTEKYFIKTRKNFSISLCKQARIEEKRKNKGGAKASPFVLKIILRFKGFLSIFVLKESLYFFV